ncbi:hypothetical protein ILUMI_11443 [Ignelater luminosus]|uniref:Uncharacterized protein n=1 Tax=Ignelater luminosus TaxID=2038154 RepID=A0A8K0D4Z9_IGNLU|nr:hypothetical protein ILUMI_11443 [Ignelater luminosus]
MKNAMNIVKESRADTVVEAAKIAVAVAKKAVKVTGGGNRVRQAHPDIKNVPICLTVPTSNAITDDLLILREMVKKVCRPAPAADKMETLHFPAFTRHFGVDQR